MAKTVGCVPCRGFFMEAIVRVGSGVLTFLAVGAILSGLGQGGQFKRIIEEIKK
jgi:hypothetical protein